MITVYDSEGKPHTVESVDAREYVASGNYFRENPLEAKPVEEIKPEPDNKNKPKK